VVGSPSSLYRIAFPTCSRNPIPMDTPATPLDNSRITIISGDHMGIRSSRRFPYGYLFEFRLAPVAVCAGPGGAGTLVRRAPVGSSKPRDLPQAIEARRALKRPEPSPSYLYPFLSWSGFSLAGLFYLPLASFFEIYLYRLFRDRSAPSFSRVRLASFFRVGQLSGFQFLVGFQNLRSYIPSGRLHPCSL